MASRGIFSLQSIRRLISAASLAFMIALPASATYAEPDQGAHITRQDTQFNGY